jgi:hypothetical protein
VAFAVVACAVVAACGSAEEDTTGEAGASPAGSVQPEPAPPPGPDGSVGEVTVEIEPSMVLTDSTRREANELRDSVIAAVEANGWLDASRASADGFVPMALDPSHWYHPEFVSDDRFFDPDAPEFLVVDGDDVVGVMFLAAEAGLDQPDPPGAPQVLWHYHRWSEAVCLLDGLVIVGETVDGSCGDGEVATDISPLMAHVWLLDMEDPFATDMSAHDHHQH